MIKRDFHVHTNYCDGKNTPEELVQKAISLNVKEIGLVCHAYTPCDESYCIKRENVQIFIDEVKDLKQKYKDKIKILCGVEYDYYAKIDVSGFDFIIGSVHYVYKNGKYISVDESLENLVKDVKEFYNGDFYLFCEDYYKTLGDIYSVTKPNFIAHFDLVTKFNKGGKIFNENDQRYVNVWQGCLDKLLAKNAVFEINSGGIIRGYKDTPYPSNAQIKYILERSGKFVVNSDSHTIDTIASNYEKYASEICEENLVEKI